MLRLSEPENSALEKSGRDLVPAGIEVEPQSTADPPSLHLGYPRYTYLTFDINNID